MKKIIILILGASFLCAKQETIVQSLRTASQLTEAIVPLMTTPSAESSMQTLSIVLKDSASIVDKSMQLESQISQLKSEVAKLSDQVACLAKTKKGTKCDAYNCKKTEQCIAEILHGLIKVLKPLCATAIGEAKKEGATFKVTPGILLLASKSPIVPAALAESTTTRLTDAATSMYKTFNTIELIALLIYPHGKEATPELLKTLEAEPIIVNDPDEFIINEMQMEIGEAEEEVVHAVEEADRENIEIETTVAEIEAA
jgi:hypothetical protein